MIEGLKSFDTLETLYPVSMDEGKFFTLVDDDGSIVYVDSIHEDDFDDDVVTMTIEDFRYNQWAYLGNDSDPIYVYILDFLGNPTRRGVVVANKPLRLP